MTHNIEYGKIDFRAWIGTALMFLSAGTSAILAVIKIEPLRLLRNKYGNESSYIVLK
jgi:hypothetical protein